MNSANERKRARRRILLVGYHFPPSGEIGAKRLLRFARKLPDWGWDPVILCPTETHHLLLDESLRELVPAGLPIHRAPSLLPWHRFFRRRLDIRKHTPGLPESGRRPRRLLRSLLDRIRLLIHGLLPLDAEMLWLPLALIKALALVRKEKIDAVFLSAPPFSILLIGPLLRRFTRARVLLDFRDAWSKGSLVLHLSPHRFRFHQACERAAVRNAHGIVATAEPAVADLRQLYPNVPASSFAVIQNSFDPDFFADVLPAKFDKFTIIHFGSLYHSRNMDTFLEGFRHFIRHEELGPEEIQLLNFAGLGLVPLDVVARLRLDEYVHFKSFVPYRQGLGLLRGAHVLLVLAGKEHTTAIPGKVYDYLGAGRPIIAALPEKNPTSALIRETGSGRVADGSDPESIADALSRLYRMLPGDFKPHGIERYSIDAAKLPFITLMERVFEEPE